LATVIENAEVQIMQSLLDRENYTGEGVEWINHAFYELGDPTKCLRELVKFWVRDGAFDMKGLPQYAQETLVQNLLRKGFEERVRATFPPPPPPTPPKTSLAKHGKPGFPLAWQTSKSLAAAKGGRLCSIQEVLDTLVHGPLYPGEDQWVAVLGENSERDWVQVGDLVHKPGTKHSIRGYPTWGDNPNDLTFGLPTWNQVLMWMPLIPCFQPQNENSRKASPEMKDLNDLRECGLLTDSEFWSARAEILGRENSFFE